MGKKVSVRAAYLCGLGSGFTWGLDTVLIGVAMAMTPFVENPVLLIGGTFVCSMLHDVFAAVWMIILMLSKGRIRELLKAVCTKDGMWCMIGALFGGPLAMTFYVLAVAYGGPGLTATVTACYPLLGTVLAIFVLKEKMPLISWIGLFICIIGIAYIGYMPDTSDNGHIIGGILLAAVAAVGWAVESVVCAYGMKAGKVDPMMALLIRELTSGLVYMLIVVPVMLKGFGNMFDGIDAIAADLPTLGVLAFTALVGMSSFIMWYTAIDTIGAARSLCLNVTYSFWAVALSFLLFGGTLSFNVMLGSIMVIAGVTIATLLSNKIKLRL